MRAHAPIALASLVLFAGCATSTPQSIVSQPTYVRPVQQAAVPAANGSIYQLATARGLFEDRVARLVGDNLTIQIQEQVAAQASSGNNAEKKATISSGVSATATSPTFNRLLGGTRLGLSSDNKFEGSGKTSSTNTFSGTITGTVVEILPNGNLVVAGEKQVNIRGEISHLRISGVVNPADIQAGNVVLSNKLADARIEEVGSGLVAASERAGLLQRFFMSFMPY
jgi:flagellar L-ring protein precursor FlgH